MVKATVEGTQEAGFVGPPAGEDEDPIGLYIKILADESEAALGSKEEVLAEIDAMLRAMRTWYLLEPDLVLRISAAYTVRLTEMYVNLHRVEGKNREWRQVRTQQVVPMLQELDRQHKSASRELEARKQDLEKIRGMR